MMEPSYDQMRTHQKMCTGAAIPGLCDVLVQEAFLPDRFEAYALPDDFVPSYSVEGTLDVIRHQHTNYEALLDELDSLCIERIAAGTKCPFSRYLASGTARVRCPYLGMLCSALANLADEKAQEAFSDWRWRKVRQRSTHRQISQMPNPRDKADRIGRATTHGLPWR